MTPDEQKTFDTLIIERDNARADAESSRVQLNDRINYARGLQDQVVKMQNRIDVYRLLAVILMAYMIGCLFGEVDSTVSVWYVMLYTFVTTVAVISIIKLLVDKSYEQ